MSNAIYAKRGIIIIYNPENSKNEEYREHMK